MFLADKEGYIYDICFLSNSKHEIKAFSQRLNKSIWNKSLLDKFEAIGDKGYRGSEYVRVSFVKSLKLRDKWLE